MKVPAGDGGRSGKVPAAAAGGGRTTVTGAAQLHAKAVAEVARGAEATQDLAGNAASAKGKGGDPVCAGGRDPSL